MTPYTPSTYTFEDAAHLLRRAGFGGTPAEIEALRGLGPVSAVDFLLDRAEEDDPGVNPHDWRAALAEDNNVGRSLNVLQAWWVHRLLTTSRPLREKLTLFWHGHFATGLDKVRNPYALHTQNELFRRMGTGGFEALVLAVSRDPAMLRYLDNDKNKKDHPNENFARELFELFTMGVNGGYTERDVLEAARAFTGWTLQGRGRTEEPRFVFRPKDYDAGPKTVLGQTGTLGGEDVVRVAVRHPATARFVTAKLWRFFVSEELPPATADELAAAFTRAEGNVGAVLRLILTSSEFYAPENRRVLVKSPVEYVVGALRMSGAKLEPAQEQALVAVMGNLAQILFYPPDVKGWDGGADWIADATVLGRLTFVGALTANKLPSAGGGGAKPADMTLPRGGSAAETVDLLGRTYLGAPPEGHLRTVLEGFARGRNTPEIARGLAYLVLASPQFHLA